MAFIASPKYNASASGHAISFGQEHRSGNAHHILAQHFSKPIRFRQVSRHWCPRSKPLRHGIEPEAIHTHSTPVVQHYKFPAAPASLINNSIWLVMKKRCQ